MSSRDYNLEAANNESRLYNYGFDLQIRKSLIKRFDKKIGLDSHKSCLEIGSFDGSMTELILTYHDFVDVIEPSSELASLLKNKFSEKVLITQSTIENVKTDKKFDYIYLIHTLEHLEEPISALRKIASLLDKDGFLFIAVPNARALSRQIAVQMGIVPFHSAVTDGERLQGHRTTYTLDRLEFDIKTAGLRVVYSGGVLLKTLANYQFDSAIASGIVSQSYVDAIDELSEVYPDFSSSIYAIVTS